MAKLTEILEFENKRTENDKNKIYLFKEGTFYRAYEYSAFLCVKYINETFKATKKEINGNETNIYFVFVGFPVTSFDKYLPAKAKKETEEKYEVIELIDIAVPSKDEFESWKSKVVLTESKPKSKEYEGLPNYGLISVMREIISYPLEQKTPVDNLLFLSELKKQLSRIL